MSIIRFVKNWTLPVAIAVGSLVYLIFYWVPQLDTVGSTMGPVIDTVFPMTVFLTLFSTFCRVDFHQMKPHRWHVGVLVAQMLLVAINCWIVFLVDAVPEQKILWESVLTCIIGPTASASPVVTGKLGGNINTMTAFVVISSLTSAVMIPAVFPLLEHTAHVDFWSAFAMILEKVAIVLVLPLILGWLVQHYAKRLCQWIVSIPDLSFYLWSVSLCMTSGVTVRNIVHSQATLTLLVMIAVLSLILCFIQFLIGRGIGRHLGEEINSGQALFQKNTALSIWVAYMYLNPVASVGAGCYVLWQNIINSLELWEYRRKNPEK
ncbi:MAG: bile acid:sodium symporter [Prevotella sp.]|nr:bile acid:sodium symporter [Prevotella sp.]